jgi:hypothetical protein
MSCNWHRPLERWKLHALKVYVAQTLLSCEDWPLRRQRMVVQVKRSYRYNACFNLQPAVKFYQYPSCSHVLTIAAACNFLKLDFAEPNVKELQLASLEPTTSMAMTSTSAAAGMRRSGIICLADCMRHVTAKWQCIIDFDTVHVYSACRRPETRVRRHLVQQTTLHHTISVLSKERQRRPLICQRWVTTHCRRTNGGLYAESLYIHSNRSVNFSTVCKLHLFQRALHVKRNWKTLKEIAETFHEPQTTSMGLLLRNFITSLFHIRLWFGHLSTFLSRPTVDALLSKNNGVESYSL